MIDFTEEQIKRYSRHILLQDVGVEGQEKIMNARVLVVGAGGLGAPVSLYLAAAGIGRIGIVDADVVDLSNLQRQIIHFTKDVGVSKVKSAEEKIKAINPDVQVDTYYEHACVHYLLLSLDTHILQQDMSRVSLYLFFCKINHNVQWSMFNECPSSHEI